MVTVQLFLVLLIFAYFGNKEVLATSVNKYLHLEYCVFVISDEKYVATWLTGKIAEDNAVLTFNSSEFLEKYTYLITYSFCIPTTYVIIFQTEHDIDVVIKNLLIFKTHTRLLGVHTSDLNITNLSKECYLRFLNYTDLRISNDNDIWNVANLYVHNVTRYNQDEKSFRMLDRKPLKVVWFEYLPYVYESDGHVSGLEVNMIKFLGRDLTLKYEKQRRRSWTDEANDLAKNSADISVTGHWISRLLANKADATVHYASVSVTFLIPRPRMLPQSLYVFRTMHLRVWLLLILTAITYASVLQLAQWFSTKMSREHTINNYNFFFVAISFLAITPIKVKSRHSIIKCMMLGWALSAIVFSTTYSAGYSAMSMVPRQESKLETLEDIANADLYCYSPESYAKILMSSSPTEVIQKVSRKILQTDNIQPGSCQEVVVMEGTVLVPSYLRNLDYQEFMLFKHVLHRTYNVVALPRNSPYKLLFNHRIFQLVEHGFISRWVEEERMQFIPANQYIGKLHDHRSFRKLTVGILQGAFILLLVGYCGAGLCFLCENIWSALRKYFAK